MYIVASIYLNIKRFLYCSALYNLLLLNKCLFSLNRFLGYGTYFLSLMVCFSIFYVILHQEIHLLKRERPFAQHATPCIRTLESDYSLYL